MEEHKCIIGQWLDYEDTSLITFKDLNEKVKEHNETYIYGLETYGKAFVNGLIKKIVILDYFDGRKNTNLIKFNYCPYCGEKIDWKKLKSKC